MRHDSITRRVGDALVAALLWPLRAIERARGWRLVGLLTLYSLAASLVVGLLWRRSQLGQVPEVGEPFDVAAHRARWHVADDRNAFLSYRQAAAKFRDMSDAEGGSFSKANLDWSKADDSLRAWVADQDEAVSFLLEGSRRPEAYLETSAPLKSLIASGEKQDVIRRLSWIGNAALFQAGRLQAEGDLVGSWARLKAVVRASRHMIRADPSSSGRATASILVQFAHGPVARWAEDPSVSVTLLRRALDDLVAAESLTPPASLAYREGYLAADAALEDLHPLIADRLRTSPGRFEALAPGLLAYLQGEPERSRRVLRLLVANDLRWSDQPAQVRPSFAVPRLRIYGPDPTSTTKPPPLPPEELARLTDSSLIAFAQAWRLEDVEVWARNDRWSLGRLKEAIATGLFTREEGRPPASPAEAIRQYLPAEGDAPDRDEAKPL